MELNVGTLGEQKGVMDWVLQIEGALLVCAGGLNCATLCICHVYTT